MIDKINLYLKATILIVVTAPCFSSAIISPSLPLISDFYRLQNDNTSALVSNFLFGYLFGQIMYSILSKIYGYQKSLLIGFSIYIFGCFIQLLSIYSEYYPLMFYARFICALGSSSGLICAFAIINDISDNREKSQELISLAFISLTIVANLSLALGGYITEYYGWMFNFYLMTVISIYSTVMIYFFIPKSEFSKSSAPNTFQFLYTDHIKYLFNYRLISASIIVAFSTSSTYLYNAYASKVTSTFFHLSPSDFGFFSVINLFGLICSSWFSSRISKKFTIYRILFIGLCITAAPISVLYLFHDLIFASSGGYIIFFTLIFILNVGLGMLYPSASYYALNSGYCSSTTSSIMNFIKIGFPAVLITVINSLNIDLSSILIKPMTFMFFLAFFSYSIIQISGRSKIA